MEGGLGADGCQLGGVVRQPFEGGHALRGPAGQDEADRLAEAAARCKRRIRQGCGRLLVIAQRIEVSARHISPVCQPQPSRAGERMAGVVAGKVPELRGRCGRREGGLDPGLAARRKRLVAVPAEDRHQDGDDSAIDGVAVLFFVPKRPKREVKREVARLVFGRGAGLGFAGGGRVGRRVAHGNRALWETGWTATRQNPSARGIGILAGTMPGLRPLEPDGCRAGSPSRTPRSSCRRPAHGSRGASARPARARFSRGLGLCGRGHPRCAGVSPARRPAG